jgi:hypothetical protein
MGVLTLASLFFEPVGNALRDKMGNRWALGLAALIAAAVLIIPLRETGRKKPGEAPPAHGH